jgi:putative NADH-flavin reductase
LAAGYRVRALVRDAAKITELHPNLELLTGDALHGPAVSRTVEGTDIVVSLIGHRRGSPKSLQSKAGHYITQAMIFHEVRRLISLTSTDVRFERDEPKLSDKLVYLWRSFRYRKHGADAQRHARLLLTSGVAWELVRVPRLTDGPARGNYRLGLIGAGAGSSLSRADLVDFLLGELETEERIFQMPVVGY